MFDGQQYYASDLISFTMSNYSNTNGSIQMTFEIATRYSSDDTVMTVMFVDDDEDTLAWYIPFTRIVDGRIEITLIDELMNQIQFCKATILILTKRD